MSSNIRVPKVCDFCGKEFIAKTTVTKYCGDPCAKKAYKVRKRNEKVGLAMEESRKKIPKPTEEHMQIIQEKHFLTVSEVSRLLRLSKNTVYRLIKNGDIQATKLSERTTRIKRTEIDKLFNS